MAWDAIPIVRHPYVPRDTVYLVFTDRDQLVLTHLRPTKRSWWRRLAWWSR